MANAFSGIRYFSVEQAAKQKRFGFGYIIVSTPSPLIGCHPEPGYALAGPGCALTGAGWGEGDTVLSLLPHSSPITVDLSTDRPSLLSLPRGER
jgi:hypothetical protein